jgi:hypothetical protein
MLTSCAGTATINWTAPAVQTEWQWICTPQSGGAPIASNIVNQTQDVVSGLSPNVPYRLQIRPICGPGDTGDYVQQLFTTIDCQPIDTIGITYEPGEDSIFVSWNDTTCHIYWEISVVPLGNPVDESNAVRVDESSGVWVNVDDANGQYMVYVRGVCEGGHNGPWKSRDAKLGISSVIPIPAKIVLAPNPAHNYTKLSIEGVSGEVEMILLTPEGKVLRKEKLNCQTTVSKDLTLQGLSKGTYLIQLIHKNWTKVEKLIVQ